MMNFDDIGIKTAAEAKALRAMLTDNHELRIEVLATDLSQDVRADLTDYFMDGQVNHDATQISKNDDGTIDAGVVTTASVSFFDPNSRLRFDSDSPSEMALYYNTMLQIKYCVRSDEYLDGRWVKIPVFTGPITNLSRDDDIVSVDCSSKEFLAMGDVHTAAVYKKGSIRVNVIKSLLRDKAGENKIDFPEGGVRTTSVLNIPISDSVWTRVCAMAWAWGYQVFYDGRGYANLRNIPSDSVWSFEETQDILSKPSLSFSGDIKNCVVVEGGVPAGLKNKIRVVATPPASHPLSPQKLGRNGVPRYLTERISDETLRTNAQANAAADAILNANLLQEIECSFDASVIPLLQPNDVVTVKTDEFTVNMRLKQFSIPLNASGVMTIGYNADLRKKTTYKHRSNTSLKAERMGKERTSNAAGVKRRRAAQAKARAAQKRRTKKKK